MNIKIVNKIKTNTNTNAKNSKIVESILNTKIHHNTEIVKINTKYLTVFST